MTYLPVQSIENLKAQSITNNQAVMADATDFCFFQFTRNLLTYRNKRGLVYIYLVRTVCKYDINKLVQLFIIISFTQRNNCIVEVFFDMV